MSLEITEAEQLMSALYLRTSRYTKRYVSPPILRKMYRQYSRWRQLVKYRCGWWNSKRDVKRIHAFDSYLAHYLLERCFWIQYGDSDMVSDLLSILFELDGHLGKIFHFRLLSKNPGNRCVNKSETDSDEDLDVKDRCLGEEYFLKTTWRSDVMATHPVKPLDYFMEHAYKKRLLFDSKRFAEQCIVQSIIKSPGRHSLSMLLLPPCAMTFKFPEVLGKLLQYGLFVRAEASNESVGKLITSIIGMYVSSCFDYNYTHYAVKILRMGNMLLRAVESVDVSVLLRCQRMKKRLVTVPRIITQMTFSNILPMLDRRCHGPQELQHLCRCQIRRRLYDNWRLPSGISFLPLPNRLKQYLSLELD